MIVKGFAIEMGVITVAAFAIGTTSRVRYIIIDNLLSQLQRRQMAAQPYDLRLLLSCRSAWKVTRVVDFEVEDDDDDSDQN